MEIDLYTPEIRNYLRAQEWPKGLIFDVRQTETEVGPVLHLTFYRDNWLTLEPHKHVKIAAIVKEVITTLRARGVPIGTQRMERSAQ